MGKAGVLVLVVVAALFALSGCGSSEGSSGNAHVNDESGETHDLTLDERVGTPPQPPKFKNLEKVAEEAGCYLFLEYEEQKSKVVPVGSKAPEYNTYPASSGPHVKPPHQQADGAYLNTPEAINVVGSLNNGRMAIYYAPDLPEDTQLELKGLYDTMYGATLLTADDEMRYAVAAVTWSNFMGCTAYDDERTLDAIRLFGKKTWGKYGNEPVEDFPFEGPTPRNPEEPESSEE
ncbi:MAG TPA: DUF3105 domain-containing protein [Solirubrobacterales bacterium]|nr:DUF3105 domain-containing protein [Solirubrobacterales bacterium]